MKQEPGLLMKQESVLTHRAEKQEASSHQLQVAQGSALLSTAHELRRRHRNFGIMKRGCKVLADRIETWGGYFWEDTR